MPLVVVGSVALDSVETPTQTRDNVLGGSAVFFSYAASFFTSVRLVGVVGEDWPGDIPPCSGRAASTPRGCRSSRAEKPSAGAAVPRQHERPRNPRPASQRARAVRSRPAGKLSPLQVPLSGQWLAALQVQVLDQCPHAQLTVADTMDYYINTERDELLALLKRIDGLVLNDSEAKLLTGDENLVRAGRGSRDGPRFVVIKKGEHGAMFFGEQETYVLPAYPTAEVVDPTGAGDSFAGGMMGYLAERGDFEPARSRRPWATASSPPVSRSRISVSTASSRSTARILRTAWRSIDEC